MKQKRDQIDKVKKLILTVHGFRIQRLKSSNVNVNPIESMRKPRPSVKRSVCNHVTCRKNPNSANQPTLDFSSTKAAEKGYDITAAGL